MSSVAFSPAGAASSIRSAARPYRKEPKQDRANESVRHILDAAAVVVQAVGAEELTTTTLAERSGMSIGTVYRYFPDRRAVLRALRDRCVSRYRADVLDRLAEDPPETAADIAAATIGSLEQLFRLEPGFRILSWGEIGAESDLRRLRFEHHVFVRRLEAMLPGGSERSAADYARLSTAVAIIERMVGFAFCGGPEAAIGELGRLRAVIDLALAEDPR